ncbi:hypothetical protein SAMN05421785_10364 [Chryseobacterium gambrini]|uniref:Uncharacterized protein n=1 Tax=Chryseobacterium gambrini TaxID=373672 RepID=A0A1N7MA00_9FLAO|nr:hypothetical protein SAMN05421785_10364 [Chryseobacterium gambrini]
MTPMFFTNGANFIYALDFGYNRFEIILFKHKGHKCFSQRTLVFIGFMFRLKPIEISELKNYFI